MSSRYPDREERRLPENRLKRISVENDRDQEGKVQKWLDIADKFFSNKNDKDNDPTPQPA